MISSKKIYFNKLKNKYLKKRNNRLKNQKADIMDRKMKI